METTEQVVQILIQQMKMDTPDFRFSQKPKKLVSPVTDATSEAVSSLAYPISIIHYGALFLKHSEFGLFKKNATPHQKLFLNTLFDGYDGRITAKHIKSEDSQNNYKNIPMNVIFFSDPDLFSSSEMKENAYEDLATGYARRFEFNFDASQQEKFCRFTDEELRKLGVRAKALGQEMFKIFEQVNCYAKYVLLPDAKELQNDYGEKLVDLKNSTKDPLLQREIRSRELKALKRAGRFAAINHPTELVINRKDMAQAILVTEELGQGFAKFLNYQPEKRDKYDKAFDFFKENLGVEFSKTDIKAKYYKNIGITRSEIRKNFDDIIKVVEEIATANNYVLMQRSAERNGTLYKLIKAPNEQLSPETKGLDNLLQG